MERICIFGEAMKEGRKVPFFAEAEDYQDICELFGFESVIRTVAVTVDYAIYEALGGMSEEVLHYTVLQHLNTGNAIYNN